MIETYIQPFLNGWLDFFTNPQKRVYWLYLLSAFFIAFTYLLYKNKSVSVALKSFFAKSNWWSKTAKADYLLVIINNFIMLILSKFLLNKVIVSYFIFYTLTDYLPSFAILQNKLSDFTVALLFTSILFILDDFTKYWVHRWLHTIPFLWPYHRVHHSSTALNFFTVFRIHPVEGILFSLRSAITQGIVVGIFYFLFSSQVTLLMLLGANLFSFLFNILGSNLRHSPIALPYPNWLEKYLISPAQHHIHHSVAKEHHNKNYGVVFSIWDRLFRSFYHSKKDESLSYGLEYNKKQKEHTLKHLYLIPFFNSYKQIKKRIKKS